MRALIDTSAIIAILNQRDKNHVVALRLLKHGQAKGIMFFLTNFMVGEVYATLLSRVGAYAARKWLEDNDIPIIRVTSGDEARAREVLLKYTERRYSNSRLGECWPRKSIQNATTAFLPVMLR